MLLFNVVIPDSKWKADKHGVTCIRLGPKGNTLLSAGRNIKLWDLETREALRVRRVEMRLKSCQIWSNNLNVSGWDLLQ